MRRSSRTTGASSSPSFSSPPAARRSSTPSPSPLLPFADDDAPRDEVDLTWSQPPEEDGDACPLCNERVPAETLADHVELCFAKLQAATQQPEGRGTAVTVDVDDDDEKDEMPAPKRPMLRSSAHSRARSQSAAARHDESPPAFCGAASSPPPAPSAHIDSTRTLSRYVDLSFEDPLSKSPLASAHAASSMAAAARTHPDEDIVLPDVDSHVFSSAIATAAIAVDVDDGTSHASLDEDSHRQFGSANEAENQFDQVMQHLRHLADDAKKHCSCGVGGSRAASSALSAAAASSPYSSSSPAAAASADSPVGLVSALCCSLSALESAHRSSVAHLRAQLQEQADEFVRVRLHLEQLASCASQQQKEELSRIRIEEMLAREEEADRLRKQQVSQESQWLTERLRVEEKNAKEISDLKAQAESVAAKMEMLSTSSKMMMEGEAHAIETGEGELRRISIRPSDHFTGQTQEEFHFRLAESQFLRMCGGSGSMFHVTEVEYILNPPLLKRYHDFKAQMKARGEEVKERLTFHGTSVTAIEAIVREGFRIGGVDTAVLAGTALGTGIYSSESPAFAMGYIKDGRSCLLFSRVCPSKDSVIKKDGGVIQQLVCKHREQIMPVYIVHYTNGRRPKAPTKSRLTKAVASGPIILAGAPGSVSSFTPPSSSRSKRGRTKTVKPYIPAPTSPSATVLSSISQSAKDFMDKMKTAMSYPATSAAGFSPFSPFYPAPILPSPTPPPPAPPAPAPAPQLVLPSMLASRISS